MSLGSIGRDIYVEQSSSTMDVSEYALAPKSPVFPYTFNTANSTRAVGSISFSPASNVVAVVDQGLSNIVWLWSLKNQVPRLDGALVQKSTVKQLLWCPKLPDILMTTNDSETPTVHQWICGRVPRIARVPISGNGKYVASWVRADGGQGGIVLFGSISGHILGYVAGSGNIAEYIQLLDLEDDCPPLTLDEFPLT